MLLLCGSDMLASFASPGVWLLDHMREILEDFGVVCCVRGENPVPQLPPEVNCCCFAALRASAPTAPIPELREITQ